MLSRLLVGSKEAGNAQSVQQTSDIFLTLPRTLPGLKNCAVVLTEKSVDKFTKNFRLFIQNVSQAWFPVPVFQGDKYVVKQLEEAPAMRFPGVLFCTKVQEQEFAKLVRHSLRYVIARTQIPNGVQDFLNAYAQKRSDMDLRHRNVRYQNINAFWPISV